MWDQTDEQADEDEYVSFGKSYSQEQINKALMSDNPMDIVKMIDDDGHGTYMAGIACGNDEGDKFSGMAPLSSIAMVKLKNAKPYLKEYYAVDENIICYQENDIMSGVYYLTQLADRLNMPLVICIALGSNLGDHNGNGLLELYLDYVASNIGKAVCVCAGNEGDKSHHFSGVMSSKEQLQQVEIKISDECKGFTLQLWAKAPDIFSVGFQTPSGAIYEKIPARFSESRRVNFRIEKTIIDVNYWILQQDVGDELIEMRFKNPTAGIWKINIYNEGIIDGSYDMWLPCQGLLEGENYFLNPDPFVTVTEPGNANRIITCAGYNHFTDSIYIGSGRGYTRDKKVVPDICAPAVNVLGPSYKGSIDYAARTGTSAATAFCAGAAALIQEWAFIRYNDLRMNGNVLRKYMIRGAKRNDNREYPDKTFGYGTLDIYGVFQSISLQ